MNDNLALTVKTLPEDVQKYISAVEKQNIAVLGDGKVFVRKSEDGFVKAVSGAMTFKEELGHIAMINGKPMLCADAYYEQNKIASCTIITPSTVTLADGSQMPNPYIIRDPKSRSIEGVWVKKACLGRTPIGNWALTTCTLFYDINMYFLQDCYKKIKKNKAAGRITMKALVKPEEQPLFLPIQGDMGIVINTDNPDIIDAIDTMIQKKLNGERLAQTIAERICMRKHPAFTSKIEVAGAEKKHTGKVKIVGWVNDLTKDDLQNIAKKIENGEDVEIAGQAVDIQDNNIGSEIPEEDLGTVNEVDETANNTGSEETDEDGSTSEKTSDQVDEKQEDLRIDELRTKLKAGSEFIGASTFEKLIKKNFKTTDYLQLNAQQLEMALVLINEEIDKEDSK